ncbi:MAG TPA: hypothetical protein VK866_05035 [Acidimicrobiales bacterium]|nr:hypothetical protein [Acidimicrobiales bacterium]
MAAPEFVPVPAHAAVRSYLSPPRRPASWTADRPADVVDDGQPSGDRFGSPGPDLGYALRLVHQFDDRLVLAEGEHRADVVAGCVALAMKRSSIFGRAPVIHDLTVAFTIWGFLDEAPAELVELRRPLFAEVAHAHHYVERREIVDRVPDEVLRQSPAAVATAARADWRPLVGAS